MAVPLVCVHGLAGSSRWWSAVAPGLEQSGPVVLLDLPHGLRPDALSGWLAGELERHSPPVDLTGHSLGALLAVRLAAASPELVRRLILVAPPGLQTRRTPLHLGWPLLVSLGASRPRFLARLTIDAVRAGPRNIVRGGFHVASADVRAELASVEAPTLLVWGARDRLVPPSVAGQWLDALPRARLVVIPDAAHVPMVEAPEALRAAIVAFREEPLDEGGDDVRM
jgi:pimeloyl-ACP methyl ester carboxylesterase